MSAAAATSGIERLTWLTRPWAVIGFFALYVVAHFLLRLLISPTLGLDDAEQAMFSQGWQLGYRFRQPPLYTWFVVAVNDTLGLSVAGLALINYACLFVTYVTLYLVARLLIDDPRRAALAAYSYLLIYVFAWFVHHDLTHTVAVGMMIALSYLALLYALRRPSTWRFALLGLALALAFLAKYNAALLIVATLIGFALVPGMRRTLNARRFAALLGALLVPLLPYAVWVVTHDYSFAALTVDVVEAETPAGETALLGNIGELALKLVEFPQPFLALFVLLIVPFARLAPWRSLSQDWRALFWLTAIGASLLLALTVVLGASEFKSRWMHPVLLGLPILLFAAVRVGSLRSRAVARYLVVLLAVTGGIMAGRYIEDKIAPHTCTHCRHYLPMQDMAAQIEARGFSQGTILTDSFHLGGNLRLHLPGNRLIDTNYPPFVWPESAPGADCVAVWHEPGAEALPPVIARYVTAHFDIAPDSLPPPFELNAGMVGNLTHRYTLNLVNLPGCENRPLSTN